MKIVIIGGTVAGATVAGKAIRENPSAKITLYEEGPHISFGTCGLPYYIGGFFDNTESFVAYTPETFEKRGVVAKVLHRVVSVDPSNMEVTVRNLTSGSTFTDTYDKLAICSGSVDAIPEWEGRDLNNIFKLKSLQDAVDIKRKLNDQKTTNVVIIGGGAIGLEMIDVLAPFIDSVPRGNNSNNNNRGNSNLRRKDINKNDLGSITLRLIHRGERLQKDSLEEEISDLLYKEIVDNGVLCNLGEEVINFLGDSYGDVSQVVTNKGTYDADLVVVATGVKPNTTFLKDTGIAMDRGAIITDRFGVTNIQSIYSAGDCALTYSKVHNKNVYIPMATVANKMGRIVGNNIAYAHAERPDKLIKFNGALMSACIKVLGVEVGRAGLTQTQAKDMGYNCASAFIVDKNPTHYYTGQYAIYTKLVYDKDTKIILGAQMLGKSGAVLRVSTLATAIYANLTLDDLGFLDLCYSPPFSKVWDPINTAANVANS